ncbi:MAG: hypothetical protein ACRDJF_00710 [Actinomycetota bacterium]
MAVLALLAAGGISAFTMYGTTRELQKAADQAALAGAAAMSPFYPDAVLESLPFPMPDTDPVYELAEDAGLNVPRLDDLVPDPRAVACAYGAQGLSSRSAPFVEAFGTAPLSPPPTICADTRIHPSLESAGLVECIDQISTTLTDRVRSALQANPVLAPFMPDILDAVLAPTRRMVDGLKQAVPAAFSPRIKVEISSGMEPPMLSIITGEDGIQMRTTAVAVRRLKNAAVVPLARGGRLAPVVGDPINLNPVLGEAQAPLIDALGDANTALNTLTSSLGLAGCQDLLVDLRTDLSDIYNPPTGPAPYARDLVRESVAVARSAASRTGVAIDELAGDAFYVIGSGDPSPVGDLAAGVLPTHLQPLARSLLGPIGATQIPTLDVAIVTFTDAGNGDYRATIIDSANARGAFAATLVR